MSRLAIGTVFANNYRAQARTLAESMRRFHPEIPVFGLCTEPEFPSSSQEPFCTIGIDELELPGGKSHCFLMSRQQLAVFAKPFFVEFLLDAGFQEVLLFDPDVLILGNLGGLTDQVRRHAVVLTPHLLDPSAGEDRASREQNILISGIYNGGCLGVSDRRSARLFLDWFQTRLLAHCRHATHEGVYYDQRWLDLAPVFFDDVSICRDPGVNAAYWNLHERPLSNSRGVWTVGDSPCSVFHFSGFNPEHPERLSSHAPQTPTNSVVLRLQREYAESLFRQGYRQESCSPYAHDFFENGVRIPDLARVIYGGEDELQKRFPDPFSCAPASYFQWLNQTVSNGLEITRFWNWIYNIRADVQSAYPDISGADRAGFLDWIHHHGRFEHGIPPEFTPSAAASPRTIIRGAEESPHVVV